MLLDPCAFGSLESVWTLLYSQGPLLIIIPALSFIKAIGLIGTKRLFNEQGGVNKGSTYIHIYFLLSYGTLKVPR